MHHDDDGSRHGRGSRSVSRRSRSRSVSLSSSDPAAEGLRHGRLSRLLHEELSSLLRDELGDPRLASARFASVALSLDHATLRVDVVPGDAPPAEALAALARASGFLRARLADALDLKRVPTLRFVHAHEAGAEEDDPWSR